jgi:hypothetical protein
MRDVSFRESAMVVICITMGMVCGFGGPDLPREAHVMGSAWSHRSLVYGVESIGDEVDKLRRSGFKVTFGSKAGAPRPRNSVS